MSMSDSISDSDLVNFYATASAVEKRAIIDALMIKDADQALVDLLDTETDGDLRRHLIQALMATGSELAEEYLFQWLEKNQ